jgi:hypothetical protein
MTASPTEMVKRGKTEHRGLIGRPSSETVTVRPSALLRKPVRSGAPFISTSWPRSFPEAFTSATALSSLPNNGKRISVLSVVRNAAASFPAARVQRLRLPVL